MQGTYNEDWLKKDKRKGALQGASVSEIRLIFKDYFDSFIF